MGLNNARCECGRPATVKKGGHMICAFCARCEEKGVCGGPTTPYEVRSQLGKEKLAKRRAYEQSRID